MADEGFHEIQLSGKHLVALFMAATVVSVVIFLCGVMVGRGITTQRAAIAAQANDPPADPTAGARPTDSSDTEPPSSSPEGAPAAGQETLSYPDRLAGSAPPSESLREDAPRAPVATTARDEPPPRDERPSRDERTPRDERPSRDEPAAAVEPGGAGFAVQVAAVRERGEADTIARRLSAKGYPAYVMPPASGAPRVFRVRVGKFKERREAEQVAGRLEKEEQFKPWITR